MEPRSLLTRHRSVLSFRAVTGVLATAVLAACSLGPPASSPVPMCSAANVYAHAGEKGVAIPKDGTASLDTTVGSSVHLTASGDCAASVRLAAAREGSNAPPYVQVETFSPTKVGTTALKVPLGTVRTSCQRTNRTGVRARGLRHPPRRRWSVKPPCLCRELPAPTCR